MNVRLKMLEIKLNATIVVPALSRDLLSFHRVRPMPCYVYILASRPRGTLYVGVTNNLAKRIYEHRNGLAKGFTQRYGVRTLVYVEAHESTGDACAQEKRLKRWRRAWKIELIERDNPDWSDLYEKILT